MKESQETRAGGNLKKLECRVEEFENTMLSLKATIDDLRKELGVD